ncbi:MAG TPA: tetratricopeptide repeat protein, partial [Candidatus Hydrogenedentes bacterium]|nr:tetratricopeptide repeat protein [Candidatus Hydrogenedentota bacterium]
SLGMLYNLHFYETPMWHTRARYMVAEFDAANMPEWMCICYESQGAWNDFSQMVRLPEPSGVSGVARYFFPVYELFMPDDKRTARNLFRAIALPGANADALLGVYEIADFSRCRFLLHLMEQDDPLLYQRLQYCPDPLSYYHAENSAVDVATLAEAAARFNRIDDAVLFYRAALLLSRDPSHRLYVARRLLDLQDPDTALEEALDDRRASSVHARERAELLVALGAEYGRAAQTAKMTRAFSAAGALAQHIAPGRLADAALTLERHGQPDRAFDLFRCALLAHPEYEAGASIADELWDRYGAAERRLSFWKELAAAHPRSIVPWLRLGDACENAGDALAAKQAYAQARHNDPDHGRALLRHIAASPELFDAEDILTHVEKAVTEEPHLAHFASQCLERAGAFWAQRDKHDTARVLFDAAARHAPQNPAVKINAAETFAASGDMDKALAILTPLLPHDAGESIATALHRLLQQYAAPETRFAFWREQREKHPDLPHVSLYYGIALADAGHYDAAMNMFDRLPSTKAQSPEVELRLRIAALAAGRAPDAPPLHRFVPEQHPEFATLAFHLLIQTTDNLVAQGRLARAEATAREATLLQPDAEAAWLALGGVLEARDDLRAALALYCEAFGRVAVAERIASRIDD